MKNKHQTYLPNVLSAEIDSKGLVNKPFYVIINGFWPNQNWSFNKFEIDYQNQHCTIIVRYYGKLKPGIALQMIKEFQDKIELIVKREGEWKVVIEGRNNNIMKQISITREQ